MSESWRNKITVKTGQMSVGVEEESIATVVLVRGETPQGERQWAYALIPATQFAAFRDAEAAGAYDLAEFGTIIARGAGEQPPTSIRQEMAEKYGCDPHFEEHMQKALADVVAQYPDIAALFDE